MTISCGQGVSGLSVRSSAELLSLNRCISSREMLLLSFFHCTETHNGTIKSFFMLPMIALLTFDVCCQGTNKVIKLALESFSLL